MITLNIDGRDFQAEEGKVILDVAREHGIDIPTLCYHEGVLPYGSCRLCMVELVSNGRTRLVASCLYPVEQGLVVRTKSPRLRANLEMTMELLMARCPDVPAIHELAKKLGIEKTSFSLKDEKCVLCGLCVRACEEVVGQSAIAMVNRGVNREIAAPFFETSEVCIGCGSCVYACPLNTITMEDKGGTRTIVFPNSKMKKTKFKLKKCKTCGNYWAPEKQVEFIIEKSGAKPEEFENCPNCRD